MNQETYLHSGAKEVQQDNQYSIPYHYLPRIEEGAFSQSWYMPWGYEYLTYITLVKELVLKYATGPILDVGCGDGRLVATLQPIVQYPVFGIDTSARAIALAQAMNPDGTYECLDITSFNTEKKYNLVTLVETLEHIDPKNISHFLLHIHRVLDANGLLIITVPSQNLPLNKKHYQHFSLEALINTVGGQFELQQHYFCNQHNFFVKAIQAVLGNRLFLLQHSGSRRILFTLYKKYFFTANSKNASRIVAVFKRIS